MTPIYVVKQLLKRFFAIYHQCLIVGSKIAFLYRRKKKLFVKQVTPLIFQVGLTQIIFALSKTKRKIDFRIFLLNVDSSQRFVCNFSSELYMLCGIEDAKMQPEDCLLFGTRNL